MGLVQWSLFFSFSPRSSVFLVQLHAKNGNQFGLRSDGSKWLRHRWECVGTIVIIRPVFWSLEGPIVVSSAMSVLFRRETCQKYHKRSKWAIDRFESFCGGNDVFRDTQPLLRQGPCKDLNPVFRLTCTPHIWRFIGSSI